MDNNETSLIKIAEGEGLAKNKIQTLIENFTSSFQEAKQLADGAKSIVVTSEDQVDEMAKARELRLSLKNVRVGVEKTRKELKEQSLREGKAIDGMANIIKALIVPVEEHLEAQEKFAERQREMRNMQIERERHDEMAKYVEDADIYSLHPDNLSTDSFNKMLETAKIAHKAKLDAEKKAEEERIAKEKADAEERARIKAENEKLKKEQEEREKQIAKEKAEADAKLKAETEAKEKAERELKAKQEADAKAKREAEEKERKEREAEAEKQRIAESAPDREKLLRFAESIKTDVKIPLLNNADARKIANKFMMGLDELVAELEANATDLGKTK